MILSFDADCNIKAVRYLAGNYGSCVDGVSTDANGNVFITCITAASTGDFANIGMGKGYVDTAVFKYNSALERQWASLLQLRAEIISRLLLRMNKAAALLPVTMNLSQLMYPTARLKIFIIAAVLML